MAWFIWLALYIASFFIQRALAPKPEKPQPKGLSDFQFPTADSSRAIPVVFGTCKITGPNVIWYGDLNAAPFEIDGQAAGFYYRLGVALGLCMGPVDEVTGCTFDEKSGGWSLYSTEVDGHKVYSIDNPMLFGGNRQGGGVAGRVHVYLGTDSQVADPYMAAKANADWPACKKVCLAVFRNAIEVGTPGWPTGFYWGTSEYIRPVAMFVTRCPNTLGLASGHHRMAIDGGYDANPACMLFEILTDPVWGLALASSAIDVSSFLSAGETLYAESLGLAMVFDQQSEASELLAEILRHVDGDLFVDPQTGLLTFALTRADYDPDTLPVLDEASLADVELTRGSWSETANVAKITYTSRQDNFSSRIAQWQNQANLQIRGQLSVSEVEFRGLSNAPAASLVAGRVLKTVSYPFARLKLKANRSAWALRPGSVFKLNWSPLGIAGMVCRVTRPAYGELTNGKLTLEAIEDAFSISGTAYSDPPSSGWVDPIGDPVPASAQALLEAPHQLVGGAEREVLALAARGTGTLLGYQVWSDPAGGTAFAQTNAISGFAALGELQEEMPAERPAIDDGVWLLADAHDLDLLASVSEDEFLAGVNLLKIDDEIMAWRYITCPDGDYRIGRFMRGVLDTVPAWHSGGSAVWFLPRTLPLVNPSTPYLSDLTVAVKVLPYNARHVLALSSATAMSLTTASRALKPLPPGKVRVNDTAWPSSVTGDAVVTWAHRHRTVQTDSGVLVSQDADDVAAAPEGTYTVQVRVDGLLKRTVTGLTGKTWTWTTAMQVTDGASSGSAVSIRIIPVNGSLSGTYQQREFQLA